jgi:DNA repair ATPase RecN
MKKAFDLQLFADEANNGAEKANVATDQENTIDTKEPATAAEPEKKYSEADLDRIIKGKKAEWQKSLEKELEATKAAEREAAKLEKMNAQQKVEYERDQLKKELDELKKANSIAEMSKTARKMLAEDGINISDDLLSMIVNTDAEDTKAAVDSFSSLFKEAVENAVKDRLRGETPKTGTGAAAPISEIDKRIKKYM